MDSLIEYISAKQFIKLAIESSYFFSPKLVVERFEEIKEYICQQKEVDPADVDPAVDPALKIKKSSISLHDTLRKKTRQTQQMVYMSATKH